MQSDSLENVSLQKQYFLLTVSRVKALHDPFCIGFRIADCLSQN